MANSVTNEFGRREPYRLGHLIAYSLAQPSVEHPPCAYPRGHVGSERTLESQGARSPPCRVDDTRHLCRVADVSTRASEAQTASLNPEFSMLPGVLVRGHPQVEASPSVPIE